ncbi:MAG: hypothetical protein KDI32_07115 [Pseudomonadales bacterium]|nr:hypothetical protein [Pseudomonadales bacterium]
MASGEFELGILTQAAAAATQPQMPVVPRERADGTVEIVTSLDELRASVNKVAGTARRLLSIYTPDLEPELYDQTEFLEIVKRFVLARRFAKVRVLIGINPEFGREQHRFLAMSRRLTSYIEMRPAGSLNQQHAAAYVIADDRALVYRVHSDSWDGVADYDNSPVARMHLAEFDSAWMSSEPELSLRSATR